MYMMADFHNDFLTSGKADLQIVSGNTSCAVCAVFRGVRTFAEIARIAAFLGMDEAAFIAHECEVSPDRRGLVLRSRPDGACVWLTDDNCCRLHAVKPDKCRTFPHAWTNPDSHAVCPELGASNSMPQGGRT